MQVCLYCTIFLCAAFGFILEDCIPAVQLQQKVYFSTWRNTVVNNLVKRPINIDTSYVSSLNIVSAYYSSHLSTKTHVLHLDVRKHTGYEH